MDDRVESAEGDEKPGYVPTYETAHCRRDPSGGRTETPSVRPPA